MPRVIKVNRPPGISFVVRCRNEEAYIRNCITSLKNLTIAYEIIVVLHKCTDRSKSIVNQLKKQGYPIQIIEYQKEVSRAGYETLITPVDHPASLMNYYNTSFSHARYNWIMKWDADFKSSRELIDYFNQDLDLASQEPTCVRIGCKLGNSGVTNAEFYLTNALLKFGKHIFWEVPIYTGQFKEVHLDSALILSISSKILKPYWKNPPWFLMPETHDKELEFKYNKAVQILGAEPPGLARASNPAGDAAYKAVVRSQNELEAYGIHLYS